MIPLGWLSLCGRILTMDNLWKHKVVIVSAYPVCLAGEETVDHLMLNCWVAQQVWRSVLWWFGCGWVLPYTLGHLFEAWKMGVGTVVWKLSFLAVIWSIWKGFIGILKARSKVSQVAPLIGKVKSTVALTRSVLSQFRDISIDSIMCNWAEGTSLI